MPFYRTCYHTLLLFNSEGDSLAAKLWPGDRAPIATRNEAVFRADAAFAKPEIYEALEERGGEVCHTSAGERQPGAGHLGVVAGVAQGNRGLVAYNFCSKGW